MSDRTVFQTKCAACPLRKHDTFLPFDAKELSFVQKFKTGELTVEAGATIILERNAAPYLYTVLEGWAFRHKTLDDGRRQILNFVFPGDLIGLQLAVLDEMTHTVTALTKTTLCVFQRNEIWSVFKDHPAVAYSLTWLAAREEQILDGQILSLGQRTAQERLAYLILNLHDRAEAVGYAKNLTFQTPFTQAHLSDALGFSSAHMSRTLAQLENRKLIDWKDDCMRILKRDELENVAQYRQEGTGRRPLI